MSSKNIVYFHNPCQDGIGSAWIATKYLSDYELVPYSHGDDMETDYNDKVIYFLDMAPPVEIYNQLKITNKVYILDHHISNQKIYKDIKDENVIFDMNKSGVGITWSYFYPDKELPYFLKCIQSRDLWKFDIEHTKDFCEGFYLACSSVESNEEILVLFDELYNNESQINKYIDIGKLLNQKKNKKVDSIGSYALEKIYDFEGHKVCMVNADSEIASELGNYLSSKPECDFAIIWRYDHVYQKYSISMRSSDKVDVSEICKRFGGGGHKNAAGCAINIHPELVFNKPLNILENTNSYTYFGV